MEFNVTYFSYIVVVSIIGGGKQSTRRKPCAPTCHKSLTNTITLCYIKENTVLHDTKTYK